MSITATNFVNSNQAAALSLPTISRARDLIASMIGCLDLQQYTLQWTGDEYERINIPGESWMTRPDPTVTRNFLMASTFSDLFFIGRAFWAITGRYSNGYPATFQWLPAAQVSVVDQPGPQFFGPAADGISINGKPLNPADVVQFLSPIQGLLWQGARAMRIANRLDASAERFATNEIAAGYLSQTGGEPLSVDELSEMAAGWSAARTTNSIGALNAYVTFTEFKSDPNRLQLVEARQFQALELARAANIPAYLAGISVGGYTYQNAQQARQDLYLFGAKPYMDCIQETLSLDQVLPRGRFVEFDVDRYLSDYGMAEQVAPMPEHELPMAAAPRYENEDA